MVAKRPYLGSRGKMGTCDVLGLEVKNYLNMVDEATKKVLASIPLLRTNAGPRDGDQWASRLKEEYISLIKVKMVTC